MARPKANVQGTDEQTVSEVEKLRNFRVRANRNAKAAIEAIRKLGKLTNPKLYTQGDEDVNKLRAAIQKALDQTVERLSAPSSKPVADEGILDVPAEGEDSEEM